MWSTTVISSSKRQNKMNVVIKFLSGIIVLTAFAACSKGDLSNSDQLIFPGNINGIVTDAEGNPINHIKVTITQIADPIIVYTSRRGEFVADIDLHDGMLNIYLEDIDGAENGGEFEPLSDMITVLEDQESLTLEYRMTLATASETAR